MNENNVSNTVDFPIQDLHAVGVYTRIISNHGGDVLVPCSKNVLNYLGAFPAVLSVHAGYDHSSSAWIEFLSMLADTKRRIRLCNVEANSGSGNWESVAHQLALLQIQSLVWRDRGYPSDDVWAALPLIKGLSFLEMEGPQNIHEVKNLSGCLDLTEISFAQLLDLVDDFAGMVGWILQLIKGSRIQRVWCEKPLLASYTAKLEAMEAISSEFLKNGWHEEGRQRALGELNFYRQLLQLDPLTSMDAFRSSSIQPASCIGSFSRSAGLEMMPPEILDRIAQFVDSKSILPLCHSIPYYKYISTAMLDFAHRFPNERYTPSKLWPDMYFPIVPTAKSKKTKFPIQHLHAAKVYSRIISKHCGNVHVPCSMNVLNYLDALPDVVSVCPGDDSSCSGWTKFLHGLANANKQIISCTVDVASNLHDWCEVAHQLKQLQVQALIWNDEDYFPTGIEEALPFISGLTYLEVQVPGDIPDGASLSRCLDLEEISIALLLYGDTEDLVERILEQIKGSHIRKVSCKIPPTTRYFKPTIVLDALETILSEFLEHGWHKEHQSDGRKSNAGGSQSSADADRVVMAYLRERGYKNAEAALNADTKGAVSSGSQIHSQ
ncbi:hypothetical protein HDU78_011120, partial [Chytriomyces hyalinus]